MLISLAEYGKLHGVSPTTVRQKILAGNLPAQKIGRNWCIDSDTPYIDLRVKSGKYRDWRKQNDNKRNRNPLQGEGSEC